LILSHILLWPSLKCIQGSSMLLPLLLLLLDVLSWESLLLLLNCRPLSLRLVRSLLRLVLRPLRRKLLLVPARGLPLLERRLGRSRWVEWHWACSRITLRYDGSNDFLELTIIQSSVSDLWH
jgi:hypothetical protein